LIEGAGGDDDDIATDDIDSYHLPYHFEIETPYIAVKSTILCPIIKSCQPDQEALMRTSSHQGFIAFGGGAGR
jgi:hypothetical protein